MEVIMQPIILAGGLGKRLWPISTVKLPKQFIKIKSGLSFFQKTIIRLKQYEEPIVIGNYLHSELIDSQLKEINAKAIIVLEEEVTGTYIPILTGLSIAYKLGKDIVGIFPTDHFIDDMDCFYSCLKQGIKLAESNKIITFGTQANFINKNYGHILAVNKHKNIYYGKAFVEKPGNKIDQDSSNLGNYFWNLGLFIFKTNMLENICGNYREIINLYLNDVYYQRIFILDKEIFKLIKKGSFDILVMNSNIDFYMIHADFKWMDIGNFKNILLYCYINLFNKVFLSN